MHNMDWQSSDSCCAACCRFAIIRAKVRGPVCFSRSFPGGSDGNESACNAGELGSIPGLGRSPGGGNDNPLQYSCLGNPMDTGAWQTTVDGIAKSRTQLSN